MVTQKAHWYNLNGLSNSDPSSAEMSKIFPSLSTSLSVEPETMFSVLQLGGSVK
jgi:hypothetical protein